MSHPLVTYCTAERLPLARFLCLSVTIKVQFDITEHNL